MTKYIAIEGGDGVGKNTTSRHLVRKLKSLNFSVQQVDFPQYNSTLSGRALGDFLSGRFEGVSTTTAAALYALDRFESLQMHGWGNSNNDFVVFDRYISSNVAYQLAKVEAEQRPSLEKWIIDLECRVYGLPQPNISVLLRLPHFKAKALISQKEIRSYTGREFDVHEANQTLQKELRTIYDDLAQRRILGAWLPVDVSDGDMLKTPDEIIQEILPSVLAAT